MFHVDIKMHNSIASSKKLSWTHFRFPANFIRTFYSHVKHFIVKNKAEELILNERAVIRE